MKQHVLGGTYCRGRATADVAGRRVSVRRDKSNMFLFVFVCNDTGIIDGDECMLWRCIMLLTPDV